MAVRQRCLTHSRDLSSMGRPAAAGGGLHWETSIGYGHVQQQCKGHRVLAGPHRKISIRYSRIFRGGCCAAMKQRHEQLDRPGGKLQRTRCQFGIGRSDECDQRRRPSSNVGQAWDRRCGQVRRYWFTPDLEPIRSQPGAGELPHGPSQFRNRERRRRQAPAQSGRQSSN